MFKYEFRRKRFEVFNKTKKRYTKIRDSNEYVVVMIMILGERKRTAEKYY